MVSAIIIALALLGFIAMDALTGRSSLFDSGPSSTVGKVNGQKIAYDEFQRMVTQQEQTMAAQGYPSGEATRQQAMEQVWNQEVGRLVMSAEIEKLGIRVSDKEINNSILFGTNPPADLRQQFTDESGQYNAQLAYQQINAALKSGTAEQKANVSGYIRQLTFVRKAEKYNSLLINSINTPRWLLEKQQSDNSQMATISLVRKPYAEINDSSVTVSDKEIEEYVRKHKKEFKQEESRSISYVSFNAAPSAADSAEVRREMNALKEQMLNAPDIEIFLAAEGAQNTFYNSFIAGKNIQIPAKDSIFKIPVGAVYGPYVDGANYSIAKLIASRTIADSVKIRHILISTTSQDPQTGRPVTVRDTASAKALADSVRGLIAAGQNFDSVALQFSEDPGSREKGGVYETSSGQMVPEFNDFIFTNPAGAKGIIKTDFGYHYIEVLSQKGSEPAYKIGYLSKPILASTETDQNARNEASQFAGKSQDQESFNANFEKELKPRGFNKGVAVDIRPTSSQVMGLPPSRSFVRKIYEAKGGRVIEPERVGDAYVVAIVTEINKEGTQPVSKARARVEPLLRNRKKAELIRTQIGTISSLEAVATALGKQVETEDSLRMSGNQSSIVGFEPKVIGAAFNPANRGKVVPEAIEGSQGVYVLRVDNVSASAMLEANLDELRRSRYEQTRMRFEQMAMQGMDPVLMVLREAATIKDNRSEFF